MQQFTGTKADLVRRRNDKGLHPADDKTKIPSKKEKTFFDLVDSPPFSRIYAIGI